MIGIIVLIYVFDSDRVNIKLKICKGKLLIMNYQQYYLSKLFELFEVSGDWVEIEFG